MSATRSPRRSTPASNDAITFSDVERRMSLFVRALWGRGIRLRPLPHARGPSDGRRSTFDGALVRLPQTYRGVAGDSGLALFRAAAAHAAAHVAFTTRRFAVGQLKPLQVALVSLIEDARVEQLALRQYPGLRRLWSRQHTARPDGAATALSLLARLSRALVDPVYEDENPWVQKGRRMFFERRERWEDQSISREIGGLLGNDLGQMRVQFNFKTYVVEPVYRDDHMGLWNFDANDASGDDAPHYQGARLRRGGEGKTRDEPAGGDVYEEQVKLVAPAHETSPAYEESLSPPLRYDEWDYIIGRDRPDWCTVSEQSAPEGDFRDADAALERNRDLVDRIKQLLRAAQIRPLICQRRRLDGDRLDLDACIDAYVALRGRLPPDPRVHSAHGRGPRDFSVLVLLDLSQSTNDVVSAAGTSAIALAQDATVLLADAIESVGDGFAIHGFRSNGRHDVRYFRFKDFDRPYDERARARLARMRGELSTRMGAALRHANRYLRAQRAHKKLIMLVTDGEPSDVDVHDARYLLFDTKRAVEECRQHGVHVYCLSLDPKADGYVSRIFGARNYAVVDHLRRLPEKLALSYMRLTQ